MPKICLVANSGGHLNQLLQFKRLLGGYDSFIVTNRNNFTTSLDVDVPVLFVNKFIIRDIKTSFRIFDPLANLFASLLIFIKKRPDFVITTGAGAAFGFCLLARLFRAKLIFVETIARVNHPSTFGKFAHKLSHITLVQWKPIAAAYPGSQYGGMAFDLSKSTRVQGKEKRIFVTFGTYQLQFNRVLEQLDLLKKGPLADYTINAQVGESSYQPRNFEYFQYGDQKTIHRNLEEADIVICHGGSGSIMDSVVRGKKVIAVPRLVKYGEFFDDHQIQIVAEMERLGLIKGVMEMSDLEQAIRSAKPFDPLSNAIPFMEDRLIEIIDQKQ